jgi:N-dimethylarginine dimethylaminohydrolase
MRARLIHTVAELERLDVGGLPARPEPQRILMCTPEHFDVLEVKNPFMAGNVGKVDKARARAQWQELVAVFEAAGHEVLRIDGVPGLEDMVFAANQVLPGMGADERPWVLLSHMRHPSRRPEVPHFRAFFARRGYAIHELPPAAGFFEGQGDAIWHPGVQLLWGGHGPRTSFSAWARVAATVGVPVITVELVHPSFYHFDTCFCVLAPDAVMICPDAFDAAGRALIERMFARVIEIDEAEAAQFFACNALSLDGRKVVLQRGARTTTARLRAEGFEPIEVETGEFLKSGGSVFCLKVMVY